MAFDFPIEADRVDNLNLFSVFLRAPVIGSLMWLISGREAARQEEEDNRSIRDESGSAEPSETLQPRPSPPPSPLRGLELMDDDLVGHHLPFKRMPPRLIHSDISEIAENPFVAEAVSQYQSSSYNNDAPLSKKEKKMSWSDESGRRLVEYVGDETPRCEASGLSGSTSGVVKPIRSAMRRSRSVRSDVSDVSEQAATDKSEALRYLPNGLSGAHNGLLMPTRPYHSHYHNHHDNMSGVESPQWGWYITTTPPTPEMHQSPNMAASKKSDSALQSSDSVSTQSTTEASLPTTNLVFQGLNKTAKPNVGWPSVPL